MPDSALLDTGPMVALFDRDDLYHDAAVEFVRHTRLRLVTTLAVVAEACHLLTSGSEAHMDLLTWLSRGALDLFDCTDRAFSRIALLSRKYQDVPMDFADATLVVAAETLGIAGIATVDRDFTVYRIHERKAFKLLFPA